MPGPLDGLQTPAHQSAYLVITLDGNVIPPRICEIGIYSSPFLTQICKRQRYVEVMERIGGNYHDARAQLLRDLEHDEFWGWSWHMLVGTGHAKL